MLSFIDDYDTLTVDEIAARLDDRTSDELRAVREYEHANKERVTLLEIIDDRLEAVHDDNGGTAANGAGTSDREETTDQTGRVSEPVDETDPRDAESSPGTDPEDDAGRDDRDRDETESQPTEVTNTGGTDGPQYGHEVTVLYPGPGRGYVAGMWFDSGPETRTVTCTRRIAAAIEDGPLEIAD